VDQLKRHCMKLFNWTNIRLVLIAFVFFLFSFTSNRNEHRKLTKSSYFCRRKHSFIKQETVNKLLIENKQNASSIEKIN
jgi:cell division protein FtsQ